jgi:hypothetical protein
LGPYVAPGSQRQNFLAALIEAKSRISTEA